ncbi:uncharacterized protein LOC135395102 [Ornithodoros turicata]|uniref:uncharacterized protein LOC135395102 n=1 Tax=Ornithodoros turicata TaxID=34597 RepID=UPI00313A2696
MLFGLPYAKPSRTALESLELLHRRGLKLALGLPPGARNVAVYAEAAALPLETSSYPTPAEPAHQTEQDINRKGAASKGPTTEPLFMYTFHAGPAVPAHPTSPRPRRSMEAPRDRHPHDTARPATKKGRPDAVAQFLAAERLHESYQDYLQVYTDASVDLGRRACALACHIPVTQFSWAEGLSRSLSSTEAELLAIFSVLPSSYFYTSSAYIIRSHQSV